MTVDDMGPDAASGNWREIARGLGFTEGPLWGDDGSLSLVSVNRGLVYRISAEGTAIQVAEPGGNPSGLARDGLGRIWIAQGGAAHASRSVRPTRAGIQRLDASGDIVDVTDAQFNAPNDLCFGPDNRLWFTDPKGAAMDGEPLAGQVYALDAESGQACVMADGIQFPNGLAFDPECRALYVAETFSGRILRYGIEGDRLGAAEIFATLPIGRPDGIAFDQSGRLHVAGTTADAVLVFERDGRLGEVLRLGQGAMPTNLCFGGEELRTLFVTSPKGGRVLASERPVPGLPLPEAKINIDVD